MPLQGKQAGNPRDFNLNAKDVNNIAMELDKLDWRFHKEQAESLRRFAQRCPENILVYKEYASAPDGGIEQPLQLGWSTSSLLDKAAEFGHGGALSMDSTFATNNLKVISCTYNLCGASLCIQA